VREETVLLVEGLNVEFNKKSILKNISFEVKRGEIVAVVGPNGAGKTTLFKAILGITPFRGEVKVLDKPVRKVLHRIGYVPQGFSFDKSFPLKVREFLSLAIPSEKYYRIDEVLNEVELQEKKETLLGELSGGQVQRALIARALINEPDILLLDEATAGVDLEAETGMYELIRHLNIEHGVTALVITHEINMAYKFATQVICLNKDLYCYGTPKEKITEELLSRLYGKDVVMRGHSH